MADNLANDPIDAEVRVALERLRVRGIAAADPLVQPLTEARQAAERYQAEWNVALPPLPKLQTLPAGAAGGPPVTVRLYWPAPPDPAVPQPVLVYCHGGGFVFNSLATHERLMRLLAGRSGWAVCAVAYGLAPEHRYPVQLEQALAVIGWLGTAAAGLGLEVGRLALGGDSAGANLALAAQVALRDRGGPPVRRGLLFYGMYDLDFETDSYRRFGDGAYGLSRERMAWFWSQYLGREPVSAPPLAVPARARLHGLAPQLVIGAGLDCLLDDSRVLAAALERAGVPNTLTVYPGVPHSFVQMSAFVAAADRAVDQAAAFLRNAAVPGGEDAAGKELGT